MRFSFKDDNSIQCEGCFHDIEAGDHYTIFEKDGEKHYCCQDEECERKMLYNLYNGDFEEGYLETAYEKEMDYADRMYDEKFR